MRKDDRKIEGERKVVSEKRVDEISKIKSFWVEERESDSE